MKRLLTVDNALLLVVFAVTVPRAGWVISQDDASFLRAVGYIAAIALDLATWRFAYVWAQSRGKTKRRLYMAAFLAFAFYAWFWQVAYLWGRVAGIEAGIKSVVWPLVIVFLALHSGLVDEAEARRSDAQTRERTSRWFP